MKKIVSSFAIAAAMTFGFANISTAQDGEPNGAAPAVENVADQAKAGDTKADTAEEAVS